MNAQSTAAAPMTPDPASGFIKRLSVEITARQADKVPLLRDKLRPGTPVFIALIDAGDVAGQLQAARELKQAGLTAIPHIPARFVRDLEDLKSRVGALAQDAGVREMLVVGGGAPQPIGQYDASIQLLETGVFEANGIARIGIAGHPEGNPDITKVHGEAVLLKALKQKQAWLKSKNIEGFIATQFLFEAAPVAYWAAALRAEGIGLPIHVGVPGPATIKTLVKYAAMCGVGNSARFIRKQSLNITKLLTVNAPDQFVEGLGRLHAERPELGIAAPHFYPFGGFDRLFDWLGPKLA
ncbi:MAG: methylenetetrahydrofolate reductase [Rhizobiales bacterium]|nr:methylenetetrahydrofolate reductase [Hyphomicrobiales bacterium]